MPQSQSADYNSTVSNAVGLGQSSQYSATNNHFSGGHIPLLTSPVPNQNFMAAAALQLNQTSPAYVTASQIPGMYIYPGNAYLPTPNLMLGTTHGMIQNPMDMSGTGGVGQVPGLHSSQKLGGYDPTHHFGNLQQVQSRKPKNSIMSKTNLYINGLTEYDTDETVRALVDGIIEPKSCKAMMSHGKCRGSGFIDCASEDDAETVIQMLRNKNMPDGNRLAVKFAYENEKDDLNVYVRNLPRNSSFTNNKLEDLFQEFGQVVSVKLLQSDNQYTGTGFVRFNQPEEAQRAVETMNGRKLVLGDDEKPVICKLADKGGRRTGGHMTGGGGDNGGDHGGGQTQHQHGYHSSSVHHHGHGYQNGGLSVASSDQDGGGGGGSKQSPSVTSYGHSLQMIPLQSAAGYNTGGSGAWIQQPPQQQSQQHHQQQQQQSQQQQQEQMLMQELQNITMAAAHAAGGSSSGPSPASAAAFLSAGLVPAAVGYHDDARHHHHGHQPQMFASTTPAAAAAAAAALMWPPPQQHQQQQAAVAAASLARMLAPQNSAYHQAPPPPQVSQQQQQLQWGPPVSSNGGIYYTAADVGLQQQQSQQQPHHIIYPINTAPPPQQHSLAQQQLQQQQQYRIHRTSTLKSPPSNAASTTIDSSPPGPLINSTIQPGCTHNGLVNGGITTITSTNSNSSTITSNIGSTNNNPQNDTSSSSTNNLTTSPEPTV